MPGTTLGSAAALVPLSITKPGCTLAQDCMCRGHPAVALMKSNVRSEATVKRNQLDASARRMYLLLPLFVALTQLQTSYVATLAAGIAAQAVLVLIPGVMGQILSVLPAMAGTSPLPLLACKLVLNHNPHIGSAGDKFARYSHSYFANLWRSTSCLNLLSQPASLWAQTPPYNSALARVTGHRMGKRVYIDTTRGGDPGPLSFADDAVVDLWSLLLAHSGTYDATGMHLSFERLTLGAGCVVGPRSMLMPGLSIARNQTVAAEELIMSARK